MVAIVLPSGLYDFPCVQNHVIHYEQKYLRSNGLFVILAMSAMFTLDWANYGCQNSAPFAPQINILLVFLKDTVYDSLPFNF